MKAITVCIFCACAFSAPLAAAYYGGDEVPVLYVPVSARATAMGNSLYCAENESIRYNPAYLGNLERNYFYATYGLLQRDTSFGNFAMQAKTGNIGWALGYCAINSRFDNYTDADAARSGSVTAGQSLFTIASGICGAGQDFSVGTAVRVITDRIDSQTSNGYNMDIGGGYLFSSRLRAGLVIKNIFSIASETEDKAAQSIILSGAWIPPLLLHSQTENRDNLLAVSVSRNGDLPPVLSVGWESLLYRRLAVRAGFDRDYPSFGAGFLFSSLNLDMALSFKEQGTLYFMTLGWTFGSPLASVAPAQQATVTAEATETEKAKETEATAARPQTDAEEETKDRADGLVTEAWANVRENRLQRAYDTFIMALKVLPDYGPALYGKQLVEREMERARKKKTVRLLCSQGEEALSAGDYLAAHKAYRDVLAGDPENEAAQEGVRKTVERAAQDMGEAIKNQTGTAIDQPPVSREDAMRISDSGTFVNFVAALRHISQRLYKESYAEWQKVQPQDAPVVQTYTDAYQRVFNAGIDAAVADAARLAQGGAYRAAVTRLKECLKEPCVSDENLREARRLIGSYESTGKSIAATGLSRADTCIKEGRFTSAAACLDRVIRCGYDAERARRMLAGIKGKKDKMKQPVAAPPAAPPAAPAPTGTQAQPVSGDRQSPELVVPVPDKGGLSEKQGKKEEVVSPALKQQLLRDYRQKASEYAARNQLKECKEYLLRILYLDPNDAAAKRSLDRVNSALKSRGE